MTRSRNPVRRRLLLGVSASALLMTASPAAAQDMFHKSPRSGAEQAAQAAAQRATQDRATTTASQRAIESFARAAQLRQRMDAAQAAARAAAQAAQANVPNGLEAGGLQVANGVATDPSLWIGANGPTQTAGANGRTDVTVDQTAAQAILTWDNFNVGRETDLTFNQHGNTDWVALNRVTDASADPSKILGTIKADGTVLVLNRNGVIFGGASQVNTRNLVAAAASITNEQFLANGIYSQQQFGQLLPSFTDAQGEVRVEAGARITTADPATVTQRGGYVLLLGGTVENAGSITTNRGQTLLSAGDSFLIRPGVSTEANQYSTTSGNEVNALRSEDSPTGAVANTGLITAVQGDITLTGHEVIQSGVALATTSVNQRGTIHLLNSASDATGSVTLTAGSLTAILPELDSDDTAVNAQRDALIAESAAQDLARADAAIGNRDNLGQFDNLSLLGDRRDQSRVEIVAGGNAVFGADSLTLAQGGQVSVSAANRIQTQNGAEINVSGVRDVKLDIGTNAILVNIQGNEQRDSPANRESGLLNNQSVWVDVRDLVFVPDGVGGYDGERYYSPGGLLEVGGTLANRTHSIGEWASIGGMITLQANEVVADAGSVFDISGGSIGYDAGSVMTTRLLGADGNLYEVGKASLLMPFLAVGDAQIVNHTRWGSLYQEVYSNALFNRGTVARREDAYVVGRDAGRLIIAAPTVVLEGDVIADVVTGGRQSLARPDSVTDGYKLSQDIVARAGALEIGRIGGLGSNGAFDTDIVIGSVTDITGTDADPVLPEERIGTALLDSERLNGYGLGGLTLTTGKGVSIDEALTLTEGGTLTIAASTTDVDADVTIRSGSVTVGNVAPNNVVGSEAPQILMQDGMAGFTLAEGSTIDLRGIWTNGLIDGLDRPSTAFVDGGDLSVRMVQGSVTLAAASLVDVSSGATLLPHATLAGGRGGNVSLIAGASPVDISPVPNPGGVRLTLDGELRAQGVVGGGRLTLQSPTTVLFGEDSALTSGILPADTPAATGFILAEAVTIPVGGIVPIEQAVALMETLQDSPLAVSVNPTNQAPIAIAADWTIPEGVSLFTDSSEFKQFGETIPAGTIISFFNGSVPAGTTIPSAVFPNGIPVERYTLGLAVGDTTPAPLTYAAGTLARRGTQFVEAVAIEPTQQIAPAILQSGFSDYSVTALGGLQITSDVALQPEVPVLRLADGGFAVPTGAAPLDALESWMPPVYLENPTEGRLTQREGTSLTLRAQDIGLAAGASIAVDPGESVTLAASGQIIVDGSITAPGGDIAILTQSVGAVDSRSESARPGTSIWIGGSAVLNAAGRAHAATDASGLRYGIAQDGGSIRIGLDSLTPVDRDFLDATSAQVVIREGAVLDASGAATDIDLRESSIPDRTRTVRLAGDGGLIRVGSTQGISNDGALIAPSGGSSAAGGTLSFVLENAQGASYGVRTLTIGQERVASGIADDLLPGVADPSLTVGAARISVEEVEAGGFGTLDLWSRDVFSFDGDVDLALTESLTLRRGALSVSDLTPTTQISLSAPYLLLDGKLRVDSGTSTLPLPGLTNQSGYGFFAPSARNTGTLELNADLIDVRNATYFGASGEILRAIGDFQTESTPLDFAGFATVDVTSNSDLRFTDGTLSAGTSLTLTANQLYPTTGATGGAFVGRFLGSFDPDAVLTIRSNGGAVPATPLSVFGSLNFAAATIDQGGVVRAPLGRILLGIEPNSFGPQTDIPFDVTLRDGSITSTSAAGLTLPYGGTADGLTYLYNGDAVSFLDLAKLTDGSFFVGQVNNGIILGNGQLTAETGSLLDVSGGGELTGAGFFTGRGGSVDVLRTALANANPAYGFSDPDAQVYAIVPGNPADYAPIAPYSGYGAPAIGQQITLDRPVGDLPAGTYTLMPSTFALLPGAYRVEIGSGSVAAGPVANLPDGSYRVGAYLGVANTAVRDVTPTTITLTPGEQVRTFSQYNETSYADFAITNAATFGALRPRLERDAQTVQLDFGSFSGDVLDFNGIADLSGAEGGTSGTLFVTAINAIEVKSAGNEASEGFTSIDANDLSAFDAGTLVVGGIFSLVDAIAAPELGSGPLGPRVTFLSGLQTVAVRDGATLKAGQIFLTGQDVLVESGGVLDTTTGPTDGITSSVGYIFSDTANNRNAEGGAILTVANGFIDFTAPLADPAQSNSITIEDGAALRTLGTIAFSTSGQVTLGDSDLSARFLTLAVPTLNIGTADAFAAADAAGVLGSGVRLDEATLERLLRPTGSGQVAVERISLTAGGSINLFGDVEVNLRTAGSDSVAALVLNTPAIYGWGDEGNVARITADTLIWNGLSTGSGASNDPFVSVAPGAVTPDGAGTGSGTLSIDARQIVFGYDPLARTQDQATLDRLTLGFATVNLNASERITANNRGSLAVYQGGTDPDSYAGGTLNLTTPVLTGDAGSFMAYRSGGALSVAAPAGAAAFDTASINALGAEVQLAGSSVTLDTTVALPSGRLVIESVDSIDLTDRADIDLSGRAVTFFDVTKYSWGGDLVIEAAKGSITQGAGSTIDVSATSNDAGTIKATATGADAQVDLAGNLLGTATAGFDSGAIDIRARALSDFAGLNERLNTGGLFEARSFVVKTGDLVIGDEVRAQRVTISADGGSLTVNGRIDASGSDVGTIRLAARDDLTLGASALLDTHGTVLAVDSYGQAIEASNRGEVELATATGAINLAAGATIDLRSADSVSRGRLEINAPRIGGDNVAVNAANGLTVQGADSVAVNAVASYTPGDGIIDQAYLDTLDVDSSAFIDAAGANAAVDARLAGLSGYGDAFHLRPGVEIRSDGDLTVNRELDFSGYRYGPVADPALRGSGEPGVVTIRAGGNLTINGSISDGFVPPPETPDDNSWLNRDFGPDGRQGQIFAVADMLAPGSLSWSMRLVGGADLASADSRTLAAKSSLGDSGDVLLDDPHLSGLFQDSLALSVIRTGTGSLDVLAGGDYRQTSLFGVYTAGTQVGGTDAWNEQRAPFFDGTLLGFDNEGYEATLNAQRIYFTEGGGNLLLAAQGDVRGFNQVDGFVERKTDDIGRWLWRQGGDELDQLTAWGVNFGQYRFDGLTFSTELTGFNGIGTLGGGNVTVVAGGDAGATYNQGLGDFLINNTSLHVAVGGSGRVDAAGVLTQTGGGTLTLDVGGRLNSGLSLLDFNPSGGVVVNLRGDTQVSAGSIGQKLDSAYGINAANDPRAVDTRTPLTRTGLGGLAISVGDGIADIQSRGNLVVTTTLNPGTLPMRGGETAAATADGLSGGGATSFNLWTDRSEIDLFAGGGDVFQASVPSFSFAELYYDPSRFSVVAADGSITLGKLLLAPSVNGNLEVLARENVLGSATLSGGSPENLTTPFNPLWALTGAPGNPFSEFASNIVNPQPFVPAYDFFSRGGSLFAFGRDTASHLYAGDTPPIRLYAVNGDIVGGSGIIPPQPFGETERYYIAGKPVDIRAGRDILFTGLIVNNDPEDISTVRAGRDIINTTIQVGGPGLIEVSAGRSIYQALDGLLPNRLDFPDSTINSIGPVVRGDTRDGASIALIAGVGTNGPDYASFAALYLNAANLADAGRALADQPGKVVKTYDQELTAWLTDRFGYAGTDVDALAYFQALSPEQQGVFVRQVYYEELRQGGREYNNPDSGRFNSYLRGRNAIASLLAESDTQGAYQGSITFLEDAGVHTDFGGDIQLLVPGGGLTLGAEGVAPPPTTGLLTQGSGDIEAYTRDSILLGLSRVFTTFGGDITMWSAEGDINAGRGAKGTIVFAPVRRTYDAYGNVDLSPTVPTSGAGIGTLNPIAEVPPGDIDLIAPLGTIDAGEAGIRVSGNVNLAALQIVNAANIKVQGEATGIPVAAAVNTGALTAASAATNAVVSEATKLAERARPVPVREIPTILNVRFVGFGEE